MTVQCLPSHRRVVSCCAPAIMHATGIQTCRISEATAASGCNMGNI